MRLLLFADLHLDRPFRWAPPEVGSARRRALAGTLRKIVDVALEHKVDALCSAGDLYEHDLVSPDTPALLRNEFSRLGEVPVLLAPGNHDWHGPRSLYVRTEWSPNVHVFDTTRLSRLELAAGFSVWGAAHNQKRGTPGFLDGFSVDNTRDVNVGLFHGSLRSGILDEEEGKEAHAPFDLEQIEASGLNHALLGHFHTPKMSEWHTYPGNPEPLSFGEEGKRGAVLVDFASDGSMTRSVIPVARTEVADIPVDVTGAETRQDIRDRVEAALQDFAGVARVSLSGEVAPDVDVTPAELVGVGSHLEVSPVIRIGDVTWRYDIDHIATLGTVQGEFVRAVREAGLSPEMERKVLITGLRALEGRKDLAVL